MAPGFAHTVLTHLLRVTDSVVIGLNLLQLLFVSLMPYSTSLFTKHLTGSSDRIAVLIFGLTLTMGLLISSVLVSYVKRMDELKSDVDPAKAAWLVRQRWTITAMFALSKAMSMFVPKVAVGFYLLLSLMLIGHPMWRLRKHLRLQKQQGDSTG